jgi:hypothetical protein
MEVIWMSESQLDVHALVRDLWELHGTFVEWSERLGSAVEAQSDLLDDEDYGRVRGRQHAYEDIARDLRVVLGRYGVASARDEALTGHGPAAEESHGAARPVLRLVNPSDAVRLPEGLIHDDLGLRSSAWMKRRGGQRERRIGDVVDRTRRGID